MEVMMSSPIQTNAEMENDRAAADDLLKRQKTEREKLVRKLEHARPHVGMIPQSLVQVIPNADLGATALVQLSKAQSKRNRKLLREYIANPEIKLEVARQIVDMITHPSIPDYSMITESSIQEISNTELGTTGEEQTEVGNRAIGAHNAKSTMLKGEQNMNIAISETVSSGTAIIDAGSKREEYMVSASGETALGTIATPDAKMVSKGEEHTEVANSEMGSNMPNNVHVDGTIEKKKKKKSRGRKQTLGKDLNPQQLEDMEVANDEMDSGTTETDNTVSKKRKRQMLENKNPASGDILGTSVGCTGVVNSEMGSSGTITIGENTGSRETSTLDAKTVSKVEECTSISSKKGILIKKKGNAPTSEKKLLVLDVNGLLADIVLPKPKDARADFHSPRGAVFKRPFLNDFLRFCFEKFHVAIWSSRTKKILDPVVRYLLGGFEKELLFMWNATNCSRTRMKTLENKNKCIVFKDLRKFWEISGWLKGNFNDSNTLLLDDSPYKALLNPKHNGIFPESYSYKNKDDNFLGPTGALRTYLEGVAATDNLKMYVEQHPFGQSFIDEKDPNWSFYEGVLKEYQKSTTEKMSCDQTVIGSFYPCCR